MYTEHFGLNFKPFNLVPDPKFLYLSPVHKKALTMLEYGLMSQAGFTVVTGEIGAGKTTLIRSLLKKLDDEYLIGLINNTSESFGELMEWVLDALEIPSSATDNASRYRDYVDFVIEQHAKGKKIVLIVDEAQNLSVKALEELRLLSNVNIDADIFMQLVLTGQPELSDKLNLPELEQFAQRIGVEYHLKALSYPETQKYIEHRMEIAGADHKIFTNEACAAIFCYSEGVPRRINNLCDFALVYAFADDSKEVNVNTVIDMIKDKRSSTIIKTKDSQNPDVKRVRSWLLELYNVHLV
ncbi:MAG: general secretion pathway protein [Methylophaga sp.]|uniref:ExeA family protein n=1 Tax=Methylophaga sp. UBA678 TaxID=1946901 RepID=UPI000C3E2DC8|nr:AAA family ATPase [Methylophaga sp. UBA678]MAX52581.1 general secretion pathway protein [Methylophaga sp.]|tara:strand:- start:43008 stop:43898 length:891 start_codon:yes stop_codon:yes gene_type:complete